MRTVGADSADQLQTVDLYTSHEALLLEYEETQTRKMTMPTPRSPHLLPHSTHPPPRSHYNTSAHFLWIGDRTRALDGAHIEYIRGLSNPIGVKVGPTLSATDLLSLLDALNPSHEIGKITLITRYGHSNISALLRPHIAAVQASPHACSIIWQCDPMHGNTFSTPSGLKTRRFGDIFSELEQALAIHRDMGSWLGGVHLELTGEPVTECVGGSEGLDEQDLEGNYLSFCDPRLNEKQALELAFLIARELRGEERTAGSLEVIAG
jgi:3-deoxy-7-phosphoheptulonate synthase